MTNHYNEGTCAVYTLEDSNYPPVDEEQVTAELPDEVVESVDKESKKEGVKVEEEKVSLVESEEKGDLEEGKRDEMEVEPKEIVEEEAKEVSQSEVEAEEKSSSEEVVPEVAEEENSISTSLPTKEEAIAEAAHRPLPAIRSRIFELYLVGNKYNPTNFW